MAGAKLTPRQKMINLMYLVLIALLALNVSAEVLRAFAMVNQGLEETSRHFEAKNQLLYTQFERQLENDEERVRPYYDQAQLVRDRSNEMVAKIEDLKKELIEEGKGYKDETTVGIPREVRLADNLDIGSRIMVTGVDAKGPALRDDINQLGDFFRSLLSENANIDIKLSADRQPSPTGEGTIEWERALFYYSPLAANVTILSKLQNDVRNAEAEILKYLFDRIYSDDVSFDQLAAAVIAPSSYIMVGEEYQADIFVSAYSTTLLPNIIVDGTPVQVEAGVGKYRVKPSREGQHTYKGQILVQNQKGQVDTFAFQQEYFAFKAAATISADKTNVLYIGLENPVSVSVPGFAPERVSASISGGSFRKVRDGQYIASVARGTREATITASVRMEDGSSRNMGSQKFRVLRVPSPTAFLGTKSDGEVGIGEARTFQAVTANLGQDFLFEGIRYTVTRYRFIHSPRRGEPQSIQGTTAMLTDQMKRLIAGSQPGDLLIVTEIQVNGPAGSERLPQGITLSIR